VKNTPGTYSIHDTPAGQFLDNADNIAGLSTVEVDALWIRASQKFATAAEGDVIALINQPRDQSVFLKTELGILKESGKITSINGIPLSDVNTLQQAGDLVKALEQTSNCDPGGGGTPPSASAPVTTTSNVNGADTTGTAPKNVETDPNGGIILKPDSTGIIIAAGIVATAALLTTRNPGAALAVAVWFTAELNKMQEAQAEPNQTFVLKARITNTSEHPDVTVIHRDSKGNTLNQLQTRGKGNDTFLGIVKNASGKTESVTQTTVNPQGEKTTSNTEFNPLNGAIKGHITITKDPAGNTTGTRETTVSKTGTGYQVNSSNPTATDKQDAINIKQAVDAANNKTSNPNQSSNVDVQLKNTTTGETYTLRKNRMEAEQELNLNNSSQQNPEDLRYNTGSDNVLFLKNGQSNNVTFGKNTFRQQVETKQQERLNQQRTETNNPNLSLKTNPLMDAGRGAVINSIKRIEKVLKTS
jgi:type IV secretory pathway TrbD component